jgi:cob(I)alamin adenosyltransferase
VFLALRQLVHGMRGQPWQVHCFAAVYRVRFWRRVKDVLLNVYPCGRCTALQVNDARTAAREAEWKLSAAENKATKVRALHAAP